MPKPSPSLRSPKADVLGRLRDLEARCRVYERRGLVHFGALAEVLGVAARAFEQVGHEPALWLLAVASSAWQRAEESVRARVHGDEEGRG